MANLSIAILGDGLLATEICKQTGWKYFSRNEDGIDFRNLYSYSYMINPYDTIVNCIANTDTYSEDLQEHWDTNYLGVIQLVDYCNRTKRKLVHICTDHIYAGSIPNAKETDIPVHARNWYSFTKLISDSYVQAVSRDYLLIRTSFKPTPFPYPKAITTQVGNFDYVDVIAKLIIKLINKKATGVYNVGTETKTIYDLAKTTSCAIPWDSTIHPTMPTDVTMNIEKMRKFLDEN